MKIIEILKVFIIIFCIVALFLYWTKPSGSSESETKISKTSIENFFLRK